MTRFFTLLLALLAPLAHAAPPATPPATPPPNVVLFFIDDLGWGDLSCQGADKWETPHLDRLATGGMRFTNFYCGQAVCSASRAALLTGSYPNRISVRGAYGPRAAQGLNPDEQTIAELLKARGYATGMVGKWHLGARPPLWPTHQGFDEFLGLPYSNDMWTVKDRDEKTPHPSFPEPLFLYDGTNAVREVRTLADQDPLTTEYTERALSFLERNQGKPFFLYFPHTMVHVPLGVSEKFRGKSKGGFYGDVMMEVDWSVGQVVAKLDELDMRKNTLVIFTSDNGPWRVYGDHAGSSGPFREGKGTTFEGGQRVPGIFNWPGTIPAGVVSDAMAGTIDILPTLCALTGADLPKAKIDGVNLSPLLRGETKESPRREFAYFYGAGGKHDQLQALRQGQWKLHVPHNYNSAESGAPGRDGSRGLQPVRTTGLELYDLAADPGERKDVAALHPDVVVRIQARAEEIIAELGSQDHGGTGVRPAGKL
jgi:arylsulfatase A-like enzyme